MDVRLWLLAVVTVLSSAQPAFSQFVGVSAFAALHPNYPCDALLAATDHAEHPAISVLHGTFGEDYSCIAKFAARNSYRPHLIQVHFSDETCRRNNNCFDGAFFGDISVSEYSRELENPGSHLYIWVGHRITTIRAAVEALGNPNTILLLSTGLEDNYTQLAYRNLSGFLSLFWPYLINRNPLKYATPAPYTPYVERHGSGVRFGVPYGIVNEDGSYGLSEKSSRAFLKRNEGALLRLLWRPEHQGRPDSGKFPGNPKERTFQFSSEDVSMFARLFSEAR